MARVLYGVMGDARGHVSRSLAVAQSMAGHEFLFIGGDKVHLVKSHGYSVEEVPMARTIYRNTHVDLTATATNAVRVFLRRSPVVRRLASIIREFDPHLILTDYEYFTPLAARSLGRSCISLDHQHILTHCDYEAPENSLSIASHLSFRQEPLQLCRQILHHFLFRPSTERSCHRRSVPPNTSKRGQRARVVRGRTRARVPGREHIPGSVACLPGKEKEQVYHLRNGRKTSGSQPSVQATFTTRLSRGSGSLPLCDRNGGHSLISESLYFGKPILCFPINMAYEQYLNAYFVDRFGFGGYWNGNGSIDKLVDDFESRLEEYRSVIGTHSFFGNARVAERLERLIAEAS